MWQTRLPSLNRASGVQAEKNAHPAEGHQDLQQEGERKRERKKKEKEEEKERTN